MTFVVPRGYPLALCIELKFGTACVARQTKMNHSASERSTRKRRATVGAHILLWHGNETHGLDVELHRDFISDAHSRNPEVVCGNDYT